MFTWFSENTIVENHGHISTLEVSYDCVCLTRDICSFLQWCSTTPFFVFGWGGGGVSFKGAVLRTAFNGCFNGFYTSNSSCL